MKTVHRRALPLYFCIALSGVMGFGSESATACSDAEPWIEQFQAPNADDHHKVSALRELSQGCSGYRSRETDPHLMDVLVKSVVLGFQQQLIAQVFHTYDCLPAARTEPGYDTLASVLGSSQCPGEEVLQRWYEVAVDSANIRAAPDVDAPRVGGAVRGTLVQQLGVEGEWMRVETGQGTVGYIHGSLLSQYFDDA